MAYRLSTRRSGICIAIVFGVLSASWLVLAAVGTAPGISSKARSPERGEVAVPPDRLTETSASLLAANGERLGEDGSTPTDPGAGFGTILEWNGDEIPGWGGNGTYAFVDPGPQLPFHNSGTAPPGGFGAFPGGKRPSTGSSPVRPGGHLSSITGFSGSGGGAGGNGTSGDTAGPPPTSGTSPAGGGGDGDGSNNPSGGGDKDGGSDAGGSGDGHGGNNAGGGSDGGDHHVSKGETHKPGDSPGQETISRDYILDGLLIIEVAGTTAAQDYDQITVKGEATLNGTIQVVLLDDFVPEPEHVFDIIIAEAFEIGDSFSVLVPMLPGGRYFSWIIVGLEEGQRAFRLIVTAVTEPAALVVFGFGLAGIGFLRRRKRRA